MRLGWALLLGLAAGIAIAWWTSRDTPAQARAKAERAGAAAAATARDAQPVLYRWRDDAGQLQVTAEPPKGRKAERVDLQPREGIEVRGDR